MIRVFGIGNVLLCDDGIGVRVVEKMKESIERLSNDVEVIIGETDFMYCIEAIDYSDFIIIVDSTYFKAEPGTIKVLFFENCDEFLSKSTSAHEDSFLSLLRTDYRNIQGYVIGIEIGKVDYDLELSKGISDKFDDICKGVLERIKKLIAYKEIKESGRSYKYITQNTTKN